MTRVAKVLVWAVALAFIGVLFYWPASQLIGLGISQFTTDGLPADRHTLPAIWFTIWQALMSTSICLPVGLVGAYLFYQRWFRGQVVFRALSLVPFMLPVITVAIAFAPFQNGNTSFWWIILAHVFINATLTTRIVGSQWIGLDSDIEEAAELAGAGRWRTFWLVTLPQLRSSVSSSAALTTVYCLASYGVILVLGGPGANTIETLIYQSAIRELDLARASMLCLIQLGLTGLVFWVASRVGKVSPLLTQPSSTKRSALDRRDWPVITVGAIIGVLLFLPMGNLVLRSLTYHGELSLKNFANLFTTGTRQILSLTVFEAAGNSIRNTLIATATAMAIGFMVSYLVNHSHSKIGIRILNLAYVIPLGVSTVILGLGYLVGFSQPPFEFRGSWLVIPLAQSLIALPVVVRLLSDALREVSPEVKEAAVMDGSTGLQIWWHVELPLARPTIIAAAGFAAVIALGDFGAASFLSFGDQETLPVVLFALITRPGGDNFGMAMAASALLMVLVTAIVTAVSWRPKRTRY